MFVAYIDVTVVNVALPHLAADLDSSTRATSWAITAYNVTFTALLVTAGRYADAKGRRRIFVTGLAAFAVGSALCALAWDLPSLVAFRVVQGIGAAVLVPVSLALLLPLWPQSRRGLAIGIWGTAGALGGAMGPPVGGILTELSWRLIFVLNVPIALVVAIAAHRGLRETRASTEARVDPPGVAILAIAIGALALAVTEGPAWGWTSPAIVGLFATAALAVPILAGLERRRPEPALDLTLFRIRSFTVGTTASIMFYFAFLGYSLLSVLFLQEAWGYSPARAGLAYGVGVAVSAATNVTGGRLVDRYGSRRVASVGLFAFGVAVVGFVLFVAPSEHPAYLTRYLPAGVLVGLALSLVFPALTAVVTGGVPPSLLATGTGVLNTVRQIGGVLGIATVVAIVGDADPSRDAFVRAYTLIAVALAIALVAVAGLRRHAPPG